MLGAILPTILPLENESNCFWIQGEQQLPFAGTLFLVKNSAAPSGSIPIKILTCKLPLEHGLFILLSFLPSLSVAVTALEHLLGLRLFSVTESMLGDI
jgi:hypothetical protein